MTCDLRRLYRDIVNELPNTDDDEPFLFTRDSIPPPPPSLSTDRMLLKKTGTTIESDHRVDGVTMLAEPATLRELALLILGVLFHPLPGTVELALVNPESDVRRMRVRFEHPAPGDVMGYWAAPTAFGYWVGSPFPLLGEITDTRARPWMRLTAADEMGGPYGGDDETWWRERDTVVGFGDDGASVAAVARLLLDVAVFDWPRGEYQLEGPIGNGALDPRTADLRIALPHSELWDPWGRCLDQT